MAVWRSQDVTEMRIRIGQRRTHTHSSGFQSSRLALMFGHWWSCQENVRSSGKVENRRRKRRREREEHIFPANNLHDTLQLQSRHTPRVTKYGCRPTQTHPKIEQDPISRKTHTRIKTHTNMQEPRTNMSVAKTTWIQMGTSLFVWLLLISQTQRLQLSVCFLLSSQDVTIALFRAPPG